MKRRNRKEERDRERKRKEEGKRKMEEDSWRNGFSVGLFGMDIL